MNIIIDQGAEESVVLTTEHSSSSYGLPVLVSGGQAYGPSDVLPSGDLAAAYVERWRLMPGRAAEETDAARAFLSQAG